MTDLPPIPGTQFDSRVTATIRWAAIVLMVVDHVAWLLLDNLWCGRIIGRGAFFLFVLLLIRGYAVTSNHQRYGLRMLLMGIAAIAPYLWAVWPMWNNNYWPIVLNIGFTLAIGMLAMRISDAICATGTRFEKCVRHVLYITPVALLTQMIGVDYGWLGVLVPVVFLRIGGEPWKCGVAFALLSWLWVGWVKGPQSIVNFTTFHLWLHPETLPHLPRAFFSGFINGLIDPASQPQAWAFLTTIPLGIIVSVLQRYPHWVARVPIGPRWFGYGFYPAHFVVLAIIKRVL